MGVQRWEWRVKGKRREGCEESPRGGCVDDLEVGG